DLTLAINPDPICLGELITLTADLTDAPSGISPDMVKWYSAYNAATGVLTEFVGEGTSLIHTPSHSGTLTYYAGIEGTGFCFDNPPASVTVTVNALPATPSITASAATVCEGEGFTLTATPGADSYRWFNGLDELAETTNELTITAADAGDAGDYTVVAVNAANCESAPSAATTVTVSARPVKPVLTASANAVCEGEVITLTSDGTGTHQWYRDGQPIGDDTNTISVTEGGIYTVVVTNVTTGCVSDESDGLAITVNPLPTIDFGSGSASVTGMAGVAVTLPTVTPETGVDLTWYDNTGAETTNMTPIFDTPGVYAYTVVATNANGCSSIATVVINIYDADNCPPLFKPYYATEVDWQSLGAAITNSAYAVDRNPKNAATVTMVVGLAGLGGGYLDLKFDKEYVAGTPVTVKLGKEYSGAGVISGILAYGLNSSGRTIGAGQSVSAGLVKLLAADAAYEFTFVPSNFSGPKPYKGVRLYFGSLLSVAENFKVYGAYVNEPATANDCEPVAPGMNKDVRDVLYGVETLGIDALSATASVVDPWNAVDDDLESAALIVRGAALLNAATITPVFKSQVMPTDSLQIIMTDPSNTLLNLSLLDGFAIQRYL